MDKASVGFPVCYDDSYKCVDTNDNANNVITKFENECLAIFKVEFQELGYGHMVCSIFSFM